jgi:GH25 family lysozyme M1 (1,4-beta-N-acetylmuramidase)
MTKIIQMAPPYPIEIVDLSVWQDYTAQSQFVEVDFLRAKSARSSLKGMIVKAGEGTIDYPVKVFQRQAIEAHDCGFGVLPYHFWRYNAGAQAQAQYFYDRVSSLPFKPARVCIDVEDNDNPICKPPDHVLEVWEYPAAITRAVKTMRALKSYVFAIKALFGAFPIMYTADWCMGWAVKFAAMGQWDEYEDLSWLQSIDFWIASYTSPVMQMIDEIDFLQVCMWQWTSTPPAKYQVDGFPWKERLDMNFWLWPEAVFYQVFGLADAPPVEPPESGLAALEARIAKLEEWAQGYRP